MPRIVNPWLSLQTRAIDVEAVLKDLGIVYRLENRGDHAELVAKCPNHNDGKNPNWSIRHQLGSNLNGMHHCWSCSWSGSIILLVQRVAGLTRDGAVEYLARFQRTVQDGERREDLGRLFETYEPAEVEAPGGLAQIRVGSPCLRYLASRGFGMVEVVRYGMMDWPKEGRLFVPIRRYGRMVSWLARSYVGASPKVLTPKGNRGGARWAMFGFDQVDRMVRQVSLVEGWASAIRVAQAGFPNPLAACGSQLTDRKVSDLVAMADEFIVWKEGDTGGEGFSRNVVDWLAKSGIIHVDVVEMPAGKDPADFTESELREMFENRNRR